MDVLYNLADKVFAESTNNEHAVKALVKELKNQPALDDDVRHFAATELIAHARHQLRTEIQRQPGEAEPKTFTREQQSRIESACQRYLMWPLMDGTRLADATREKVLENATRYQAHAEGNALKARFLELVAGGLKTEKQTVAEVYNEADLARLMGQARKKGRGNGRGRKAG